jgi:hypothetical protein
LAEIGTVFEDWYIRERISGQDVEFVTSRIPYVIEEVLEKYGQISSQEAKRY